MSADSTFCAFNWNEKNKLTQKLREKEAYNPISFLPEFHNADSPYFASFSIEDDNPKIGSQKFLLGKQNLFKEKVRKVHKINNNYLQSIKN